MKALSRERLKLDDHFDVSHVGAKFPKLAADNQAWLRQRLGRAITHRRQFLRYTREHRDKLESPGVDDALMMETESRLDGSRLPRDGAARGEGASRPSTFFTKATTIDPTKISSLPLSLDQESDAEDDAKSYTTISRSVDGDLDTSLSDRVPKLQDLQIALELERSPVETEITNRTLHKFAVLGALGGPESDDFDWVMMSESASRLASKLGKFSQDRAMQIHRDYVQFQARRKREIECPFCCEIMKIKDEKAWRRHVYADLRPYVCTFADCSKPYFDDLNEWFNHEMQSHRVSHVCQLCQGKLYSSDRQYLDHVRRRHPALWVDGGEQALLDIGKKPVQQISAEDCPCCTDWTDRLRRREPGIDESEPIYATPAVFKKHIASHLEQLAFFALPLPTSDNDGQDSQIALNVETEEDGKPAVLSSLSFDSQPQQMMDIHSPDLMHELRRASSPTSVLSARESASRRSASSSLGSLGWYGPTSIAGNAHQSARDDPNAKKRLERLRRIGREEERASYQQAMPNIKMTVEEWSETAEKLQRYARDMTKIGRGLAKWHKVTEDDGRARLFFRMRLRILQQFVDGEAMSIPKDTFSIDSEELDQTWALLEGMTKDLAKSITGPWALQSEEATAQLGTLEMSAQVTWAEFTRGVFERRESQADLQSTKVDPTEDDYWDASDPESDEESGKSESNPFGM